MKPFAKILVPTDFSEGAHAAVERALDLRQRFGASMTLVHVYQLPISYPNGYVFTADIIASIEDAARKQMAEALKQAEGRARELAGGGSAPTLTSKLLIGTPSLSIVEEAKSGAYDLIVMGTHGRTGLSRLFIGSVAERVVRGAHCEVLTVR